MPLKKLLGKLSLQPLVYFNKLCKHPNKYIIQEKYLLKFPVVFFSVLHISGIHQYRNRAAYTVVLLTSAFALKEI